MKTLLEKEKMLETSIFYFSHDVFYPIREKLHQLNCIEIVSANAFNLDKAKILSSGKGIMQCKMH